MVHQSENLMPKQGLCALDLRGPRPAHESRDISLVVYLDLLGFTFNAIQDLHPIEPVDTGNARMRPQHWRAVHLLLTTMVQQDGVRSGHHPCNAKTKSSYLSFPLTSLKANSCLTGDEGMAAMFV